MNLFRKIRNWLKKLSIFAPPTHDKIFSTLQFFELNVNKIKSDLELDSKGTLRGNKNEPHESSENYDDVEQEIVNYIERERKNSYEKFLNHLSVYKTRLESLNIGGLHTKAITIAGDASAKFLSKVRVGQDLITSGKQSIQDLNQEIHKFKVDNNILRSPQYPTSQFFYISIILSLLLIETFLNGTFFSKGHELGLLGGSVEAFLVSCINVGLGFIVGWRVLPNINHVRLQRKIFGYSVILIYFLLISLFNILVAHYRIALAGDNPQSATTEALATFMTNPFRIPDLQSILLMIVGISFSIIAFVDGYKFDDPYPGYGSLDRRKVQFEEDYILQKQELYREIDVIKEQNLALIDESLFVMGQRNSELNSILINRQKLLEKYKGHLSYLENVCNELLNSYRVANKSSRTAPPPYRFNTSWQWPTEIGPSIHDMYDPGEASLDIDRLISEVKSGRDRILKDHKKALIAFEQLEELTN